MNKIVTVTKEEVKKSIEDAKTLANQMCSDNSNLVKRMENLEKDTDILLDNYACEINEFIDSPDVCDLSKMIFDLSQDMICKALFTCDNVVINSDTDVSIVVSGNVYIDESTQISISKPTKASNGADSYALDSDGQDGTPGLKGHNLSLLIQ